MGIPDGGVRFALRAAKGLGYAAAGLVRGAAGRVRQHRRLDPRRPPTWEYRALSQDGEDGILDHLVRGLMAPNRFFLELGGGYGVDGNGAWLALAGGFSGILVEADRGRAAAATALLALWPRRLAVRTLFLTRENVGDTAGWCPARDPDLVTVDVDGVDWHLLERLLEVGLRPALLVVEYNSTFGPEECVTVPYRPDFDAHAAHPSGLYHGASIAAWRHLLEGRGYRFVTVTSSGVNAVFADPDRFRSGWLDRLEGRTFAENAYQRPLGPWPAQRARIAGLPLLGVG